MEYEIKKYYDDNTLDYFDHVYEAIKDPQSPEYDQYMEIVRKYNFHPDDDFEKILNIMVEETDISTMMLPSPY